MTAHKSFVEERKEFICDWRGKQDAAGAQAFFTAQSGGGQAEAPKGAATPKPAAAEETKAAPAKPAGPKKAAPKVPVKEKRGNKWVVENFSNETINFGEDELDNRTTFEFFNCSKVEVNLVGKCQYMTIQSCKGFKIHVDKVISQIEIFKC